MVNDYTSSQCPSQATTWRLTCYNSERVRQASFEPTCNDVVVGRGTSDIHQMPSMAQKLGREFCAAEVNDTLFICVPSNMISRRHLVISRRQEDSGNTYWGKDQDSGSGTYVNGVQQKSNELFPVKSGDQLKCGATIIVFRDLELHPTIVEPRMLPKKKAKPGERVPIRITVFRDHPINQQLAAALDVHPTIGDPRMLPKKKVKIAMKRRWLYVAAVLFYLVLWKFLVFCFP